MKKKTYGAERPSIPADVRRSVEVEAGHSCTVFNCTEHTYLEIHHINENREDNRVSNLILLCDKHHKMAHKGVIDRKALKEHKKLLRGGSKDIDIQQKPWQSNVSQLYYINVPRLAVLSEMLGYKINQTYFEKLDSLNSLDGQLARVLYQFGTLLEKIHPLTTDLESVDPRNDDYIGLTVSYSRRFYTKFVPGYDDFVNGKYKIHGDYSKDPQIYCKIDGYKAILLIDPRWMAFTTSFVNMKAGNGKFAGLCTIKDIYHEDEVLLATPIIIGIPKSPIDALFG